MPAPDATGNYRESTKRTLQLLIWGVAWCATLAVAKFGPEFWWGSQQTLPSWAAIVVNFAVGIAWIVTFTRFIRALDELDRKIMLDALAITLGAGWIGGFAWVVADAAGLLPGDIEIAIFPAALAVVFLIAFFAGKVRYR